ncbi:MAG TPA: DUF3093 domain-containing protein [Candidatus Aquiluna sp.]|nr:DUF3093 domain-containing protein [Aquiluna sp.]
MYPSVGFLIAMSLSAPLVLLSVLPVSQSGAVVMAGLVPVALVLLSIFSAPTIQITENIRAGRINVPLSALGEAFGLEGDQMKTERGPGLSPAAQFVIRGDIKFMVKVRVTDPNDPTAYLLISTRNPSGLASAINANRS